MGAPPSNLGLFETSAPPIESAPSATTYVELIVREPLPPLSYAWPPRLGPVLPGCAVEVMLRNRKTVGYVLGESPLPAQLDPAKVKEVEGLAQESPSLPPNLLSMITFASRYYRCPAGALLHAALPVSARRQREKIRLRDQSSDAHPILGEEPRLAAIVERLQKSPQGLAKSTLSESLGLSKSVVDRLVGLGADAGLLERATKTKAPRKLRAYQRKAVSEGPPLRASQVELLEAFPDDRPITVRELSERIGSSSLHSRLRRLEELGYLEASTVEQRMEVGIEDLGEVHTRHNLTADQEAVVEQVLPSIRQGTHQSFLLHGVTGSGKTEVYLRLIEAALAEGRTAMVLVPEIALTPQLGARFKARFGDAIATFHSGLSPAERRDEWRRVYDDKVGIVLGARSAVFLPLRNLGLIVVDEEHESSFKQDESPAYHGRDLAIYRAHQEKVPIVLGSATPSLESLHNVETGRAKLLSLPERINQRPLPEVELVDLRKTERIEGTLFSQEMLHAIEDTIARDEQVILFLNRRGYAPYVYCTDCGIGIECPDCSVSLTLHRRRDQLMCHYCGYQLRVPEHCPDCHSLNLMASGVGTERVEQDLKLLLDDPSILRLDRDKVRKRSDIDRILRDFRMKKAQILIGTQMVTKGHDFPDVTLVGILMGDASLHFPDFRAAERTFQLLTQVAGRAGRAGSSGRVLCQCFDPEHYAIQYARKHDYNGFAQEELKLRRDLGYAPYARLALLRAEGPHEKDTEALLKEVCAKMDSPGVQILGPAPAPLQRLRGQWRFQALLKAPDRQALGAALRKLRPQSGPIRLVLDIDPVTML